MSIYVPHESILRCSQSVKVSRLNVTSQRNAKLADGRLKGTWVDKMDENFVCPYISAAGIAAGMVVVASLGPLGMLTSGLMTLVGGLAGGVSGAVKGWNKGSKTGGRVGAEIGAITGSAVGANLGGTAGALEGAVKEGSKGYIKGAEAGGQIGSKVGRQAGQVAGGVAGASAGANVGAAAGVVKGAQAGSTAGGEIGREVGETAGTGAGAVAGLSIAGPAGIAPGAQAGKAVGGTAGEVQGQLAGATLGAVAGAVGGTIDGAGEGYRMGKELGGNLGEGAGRLAGMAVGANLAGTAGAARGAVEGGTKGYIAGAQKGEQVGRQIGSTVGSVVGGAGEALDGFAQGFAAGGVKGGMFLPSYLGGLLMHIPPICAIITSPVWLLSHPTVKIERKFALLHTSILPCLLGGIIKPWIEDLTPHLRRALISEAIYYNPDNEAEMKEMLSNDEFNEWKSKQAAIFQKMEDYGIKKETPRSNDLKNKMKTKSGFMAEIYSYQNKEGKEVYVMAFKGTDNDLQPGQDWKTNGEQAVGLESEQYSDTEKAAKAFEREYPDNELEFAGHSKAGGQATLAAAVTKKKATVFNPAGVNNATFERAGTTREMADQYVTSFHSQNSDILDTLQDHTYGLIPQAAGDRIGLKTKVPYLFPDPVAGHNMEHLIEMLEEEVKRYKRLVKAEEM